MEKTSNDIALPIWLFIIILILAVIGLNVVLNHGHLPPPNPDMPYTPADNQW